MANILLVALAVLCGLLLVTAPFVLSRLFRR